MNTYTPEQNRANARPAPFGSILQSISVFPAPRKQPRTAINRMQSAATGRQKADDLPVPRLLRRYRYLWQSDPRWLRHLPSVDDGSHRPERMLAAAQCLIDTMSQYVV